MPRVTVSWSDDMTGHKVGDVIRYRAGDGIKHWRLTETGWVRHYWWRRLWDWVRGR